jgi:hypothetical protein
VAVVDVESAVGEYACSSGESGNDVSDSDERTDEAPVSEGDDEVVLVVEQEQREEEENVVEEELIAHSEPRQQEVTYDNLGWTKQTSKKKAKKQAIKAEALTAQAAAAHAAAIAARPITASDGVEAKRDTSTPSLKRHTPFESEPKEKHRFVGLSHTSRR